MGSSCVRRRWRRFLRPMTGPLTSYWTAPERCPRYVGRVIENVDLSRPSPLWLQERLRRAGLRSIDPAVDVTNYVLLELGQPMHAFDLDTLQGGIVVRCARAGESLELLDGQTAGAARGQPGDRGSCASTGTCRDHGRAVQRRECRQSQPVPGVCVFCTATDGRAGAGLWSAHRLLAPL